MQTKTRIVHVIAVALAVLLMQMPFAIIQRTIEIADNGVKHEMIQTMSYVDAALFANGNLLPVITALLTCVLLLLVFVSFYLRENLILKLAMSLCSLAALVLSLLPIVLQGLQDYTPTALAVSYLLGCSLLFSIQHLTGKYFCVEKEETE